MSGSGREHPLYLLFLERVQHAMALECPQGAFEDVEDYLASLLVAFARTDSLFRIRDASGRSLSSVFEMLAEGDVRLNADSFERERDVHKHIGDYILFWSGLNPMFLRRLKLDDGRELLCDYTLQGKESYRLVSSFDYRPYDSEAPTYRKLSESFEVLSLALARVGRDLPFHAA
ncbi:MAG: hypothetical protein JST30_00895 [Armatimonadetes bacterium]|nr:hypothetical protein [Armatimonadota bacterium]